MQIVNDNEDAIYPDDRGVSITSKPQLSYLTTNFQNQSINKSDMRSNLTKLNKKEPKSEAVKKGIVLNPY